MTSPHCSLAQSTCRTSTVAWARANAALHTTVEEPHGKGLWGPFSEAWSVLIHRKVLREGLSEREALALLGPPSQRTGNSLTWYASTPRHVNPLLALELKGAQVASFHVSDQ